LLVKNKEGMSITKLRINASLRVGGFFYMWMYIAYGIAPRTVAKIIENWYI
jgi:hypothetical protein